MLRTRTVIFVVAVAAVCMFVLACEPEDTRHGCKVLNTVCYCGYGCKTEFIYRTRRQCLNALRKRSPNVCTRIPCSRGICTQTLLNPGYACKCEGTGFYGQRCEKDRCPEASPPSCWRYCLTDRKV